MKKINHEQLKRVISTSYDARVPLFIHGQTGIGKSETVKTMARILAKSYGCTFLADESGGKDTFGFIDVRISQLDPSDLRGLPSIGNGVTKWLPPSWLPSNAEGSGILFFDEINLAPPSVQSACYQLILDRKLGDYKLPDGWVVVAAGNTSEDRANIFELPAPLANRFIHVQLMPPTKEEWTSWAMKHGVIGDIVAFLEFKPNYLFKFDSKSKDKSFPTPRAWNYVNKLLNERELNDEEVEILVSAAVGEAVGIEYAAWHALKKKINIDDVLKNPKSVGKIEELSLKYSLLSALVEKYREDKNNLEPILKVCGFMEAEFSILQLRFMREIDLKFAEKLIKSPEWIKVLSYKYAKYLL